MEKQTENGKRGNTGSKGPKAIIVPEMLQLHGVQCNHSATSAPLAHHTYMSLHAQASLLLGLNAQTLKKMLS